jgi:hypothetical protein
MPITYPVHLDATIPPEKRGLAPGDPVIVFVRKSSSKETMLPFRTHNASFEEVVFWYPWEEKKRIDGQYLHTYLVVIYFNF